MTRWRIDILALAAAMLALSASTANAQTLYGITLNNQLITIDPITGAGTLVGPLSSNMAAPGLGFRGSSLYTWDEIASRIRQLDPATGATVNTINIGLVGATGGDVSFRSDGLGFLCPGLPVSRLISFDVTVPNSTVLGPLNPIMYGLAFSPSGVLFGLSQTMPNTRLYTIDQTTAATTLVGSTGLPWFASGGMACHPTSGTLFACLGSGAVPSSLYQIDPATGVATLIGSIGFTQVSGLAFQPLPPPPLPPPPPPPSGSEGSFAGTQDPPLTGSEGCFGSGGHLAVQTPARPPQLPRLVGPFLDSLPGLVPASSGWTTSPPAGSSMYVFNVSGRPQASGISQSSGGHEKLGWALLSGLALGAAIGLARTIAVARFNPANSPRQAYGRLSSVLQHRAQEPKHLLGRPVAGQPQVGIDGGVVLPLGGIGAGRQSYGLKRLGKSSPWFRGDLQRAGSRTAECCCPWRRV